MMLDVETAGDRPATKPTEEIEVTPEMIEAGALALMSFDSRYESCEQGAMAVFEAMIAAS